MEHDLIRRSKLLAKKCLIRGYLDTGSPCPSKVKAVPVDVIEREPAVDAVPVRHGRWVDHCVRDWRCSECGDKIIKFRSVDGYCYDDKPNFCPNCGKKMDLKGETEDG